MCPLERGGCVPWRGEGVQAEGVPWRGESVSLGEGRVCPLERGGCVPWRGEGVQAEGVSLGEGRVCWLRGVSLTMSLTLKPPVSTSLPPLLRFHPCPSAVPE